MHPKVAFMGRGLPLPLPPPESMDNPCPPPATLHKHKLAFHQGALVLILLVVRDTPMQNVEVCSLLGDGGGRRGH